MKHKNFVNQIARAAKLEGRKTGRIYNAFREVASRALADGERVNLTSLGSFVLTRYPARHIIDPQNPARKIFIPSQNIPKFRPASNLLRAIKDARVNIAVHRSIPSSSGALDENVIPAAEKLIRELPGDEAPIRKFAPLGTLPIQDEVVDDTPTAKVVWSVLRRAIRERASDIHIEPEENQVIVRFRIDGILERASTIPKELQSAVITHLKALAGLKIDENRTPQTGRFEMHVDSHEVDFRVSTFPTVNGEKILARLLDKARAIPTLEELGVGGRNLESLNSILGRTRGITLVTGPNDAGKTTTLYAMLAKIKNVALNIMTVEDPVEYRLKGINQSEVNPAIDYTFAAGLRSIIRQDPNVILVGELADQETAHLAVQAALAGHIVLSTLPTKDAPTTIPYLFDLEVEASPLAATLNVILAQRLVRKICQRCRKEVELSPDELEAIRHELHIPRGTTFFRGEGCDECNSSGYLGRIGIFEVLPISAPIRDLILKLSPPDAIKAQALREGFSPMRLDGIQKAIEGLTTIEEVWRVTQD